MFRRHACEYLAFNVKFANTIVPLQRCVHVCSTGKQCIVLASLRSLVASKDVPHTKVIRRASLRLPCEVCSGAANELVALYGAHCYTACTVHGQQVFFLMEAVYVGVGAKKCAKWLRVECRSQPCGLNLPRGTLLRLESRPTDPDGLGRVGKPALLRRGPRIPRSGRQIRDIAVCGIG